MVGPFMQGMLLIGIIYWYTKGMLSMINDYYRSEFSLKLKTENDTTPNYDVDNMENLIEVAEKLVYSEKNVNTRLKNEPENINFNMLYANNYVVANVCPKNTDLFIFMKLVMPNLYLDIGEDLHSQYYCLIERDKLSKAKA